MAKLDLDTRELRRHWC